MPLTRWWSRAFLQERPSIGLSLFRFAIAFTVGAHVIPSLLHPYENYLHTAFKTKNPQFFPAGILELVETSPDWLVYAMIFAFLAALASFALGLYSQISCILLTLCCYYFYALNDFHIGTLSYDILLVTLALMCVTGYHGDSFSLDSLRRANHGDPFSWRRTRPFFVQRLLQLQIAWTFWYTAIAKASTVPGSPLQGNWLTDNPYFALMHYPPMGVVRDFPMRAWLGQHADLCYGLGIALILFELALPFLWFIPRARALGIGLGIAFQLMLWMTLHVPTIFLFLFPAQMLLFIPPERIVAIIERQRAENAGRNRAMLFYDGDCGFCRNAVRSLRTLDIFGYIEPIDFRQAGDLSRRHPALTPERCNEEMVLLDRNRQLYGGFFALRRMTLHLPLLWWAVPLAYLPGSSWAGQKIYRWIARRRYRLSDCSRCSSKT